MQDSTAISARSMTVKDPLARHAARASLRHKCVHVQAARRARAHGDRYAEDTYKIIDMVRCNIYADARARVAKWAVGKVGSAAGGVRFISTYAYVLES